MPRIEMTRTVRVSLYGLLVYLIVMLSLIAVKFVRVAMAPDDHPAAPTSVSRAY